MIFSSLKIRSIIVFVIFLIYSFFLSNVDKLYYDSADYWYASVLFFKKNQHNNFNILNFDNSMRGYIYPFVLLPAFVFRYLLQLDVIIVTKLIGSFVASILIAYVLPSLYEIISNRNIEWTFYNFFALVFFVMFFWCDYFLYTLSDIPAVLCLYLSVIMLRKKKLLYWFVSGLFIAASINMRPVYVIVLPLFMILSGFYLYRYNHWLRNAIVMVFGSFVILLPQMMINYANFDSISPLVLAKNDKVKNLYVWHLRWGMHIQKFETNIGYKDKNKPCAVIKDIVGYQLIKKVNGDSEFKSIGDYIKGGVQYPFSYLMLYMRHVFNMFDLKYSTPYIKESDYNISLFFSIVNYNVILLGVFSCLRILYRSNSVKSLLIILMPVSLMLVSVPIVVECRFIMPLHLLFILVTCFELKPAVIGKFLSKKKYILARVICVVILWVVLCVSLTVYFQQFVYHRISFAG